MIYSQEDILGLEKYFRRNLINSLTGFKSLNLVGTIHTSGQTNLAPFSQVIHVGASPPLVGILFRPHVVTRHTLENIMANEHFTLNHVTTAFVKEAHHTAARWPESEFEATDLEVEYLEDFPAPFVKAARVKYGCKLEEKVDIKSNGTHFIVGRIHQLIIPEEVIEQDGFIDLEAADTITVSGLDSYHTTKKIARFAYPKPDQELKKI
jgi:flavin reductase (DIM6/NTAB) family NADH-FMN oxidoreductase RutF